MKSRYTIILHEVHYIEVEVFGLSLDDAIANAYERIDDEGVNTFETDTDLVYRSHIKHTDESVED